MPSQGKKLLGKREFMPIRTATRENLNAAPHTCVPIQQEDAFSCYSSPHPQKTTQTNVCQSLFIMFGFALDKVFRKGKCPEFQITGRLYLIRMATSEIHKVRYLLELTL